MAMRCKREIVCIRALLGDCSLSSNSNTVLLQVVANVLYAVLASLNVCTYNNHPGCVEIICDSTRSQLRRIVQISQSCSGLIFKQHVRF